MIRSSRRTGLAAVAVAAFVMSVAAACSSSTEGSDPTSTLPTASGTVPPGDDESTTSTTRDEPPRTGTSLIGDDEDPPTGDETEQDYIDALVATFEADDDDQLFSQGDVECLAAAWVPAIGVETFQAEGITPADIEAGDAGIDDVILDRSTAEDVVDAIPECGIDLMDIFIDTLGSDVADDPAKVACVEGAVTEEQIRDFLVDDILGAERTGDRPDPEQLVGPCLV